MKRASASAVLLAALASGGASGQSQPTFRGGTTVVEFTLLHFRTIADKVSADVEIAIAEKSAKGDFEYRLRTSAFVLPEGTALAGTVLRYQDRWKLRPGTAIIRVLVRDRRSGRYGTLDVPVNQIPAARPAPEQSRRNGGVIAEVGFHRTIQSFPRQSFPRRGRS